MSSAQSTPIGFITQNRIKDILIHANMMRVGAKQARALGFEADCHEAFARARGYVKQAKALKESRR